MRRAPKLWYRSRMLWFNALTCALAAVELNLHLLQSQLQPTHYLVLLAGVTAVNVILRAITRQPLQLRKDPDAVD